MIKIKNLMTEEVREFTYIDTALRTLQHNGQPLLSKPGRKTLQQAKDLLAGAGYALVMNGESHEDKPKVDTSEVMAEFAKAISKMMVIDEEKVVEIFNEQMEGKADEITSRVGEMFDEFMKNTKPSQTECVIVPIQGESKNMGVQHKKFSLMLSVVGQRLNVLMVGSAGSGKTIGAEKVAEALGLPYYTISVGMQTTKSEFFGYMSASGTYVRTLFREAFENGGVFLLDELDAGNANVIVAINQGLANGKTAFPDGMVNKHPDFVLIATANTWGAGANREYVGRNQLDASTLDRFKMIEWGYDLDLEDALTENKGWLAEVRRVRAIVEKNKIRQIISPRASIDGTKLLKAGVDIEDVIEMTLFKGMNATERELCKR